MPDVGCEIVDVRHIFGTLIVANLCHFKIRCPQMSQMGTDQAINRGNIQRGKSSAPICADLRTKHFVKRGGRLATRTHNAEGWRIQDTGVRKGPSTRRILPVARSVIRH